MWSDAPPLSTMSTLAGFLRGVRLIQVEIVGVGSARVRDVELVNRQLLIEN